MALALILNHSALKIGGAVILPNFAEIAHHYLMTKPNIENGWYAALKKPPCDPPSWLIGPAWFSMYSVMGYASYVVWQEGQRAVAGSTHRKLWYTSLAVYGVQWTVSNSWTPIFFGRHALKGVSKD